MLVATYNAASVRARMPLLLDWIAENQPDVLALQETKVEDDKFPRDELEEIGYHAALNGQKSWNGVAILGKHPPTDVEKGFGDPLMPEDGRLIAATIGGLRILNSYVPNGSAVGTDKFAYKLQWLERFRRHLDERYRPDQALLWLGDVNIAPKPDDVFNSPRHLGKVCHHPEEFARLGRIVAWGLHDVYRRFHQGPGHYTYWEFTIPRAYENNLGWRIDHIYGTAAVAERFTRAWIDREARGLPKPSDHTFVVAELRWP